MQDPDTSHIRRITDGKSKPPGKTAPTRTIHVIQAARGDDFEEFHVSAKGARVHCEGEHGMIEDWSAEEARALAHALLTAADEAEDR